MGPVYDLIGDLERLFLPHPKSIKGWQPPCSASTTEALADCTLDTEGLGLNP